jgi:hypothetical protein
VSAAGSRCDRSTTAAAVLLLVCSLGCWCIADALGERLEQIEPAPPGPLASLDGLFARRLEQIETPAGGMLTFVGADGGGNP